MAFSAPSPFLGPALTILVYPPTFLSAYFGAISLNNFAGRSTLFPSLSFTLLIVLIIFLLAFNLDGMSFCLFSVVSSLTTFKYSLPFLLFTSSVILLPFESSLAFTTFASTVSKLSFSFIANAIIESAIAFTSFALGKVASANFRWWRRGGSNP